MERLRSACRKGAAVPEGLLRRLDAGPQSSVNKVDESPIVPIVLLDAVLCEFPCFVGIIVGVFEHFVASQIGPDFAYCVCSDRDVKRFM